MNKCLADCELSSGWAIHVDISGENYDVLVTGPKPGEGIELHLWETLPKVYESLETFFAGLALPHVWVALRASVEAELRS